MIPQHVIAPWTVNCCQRAVCVPHYSVAGMAFNFSATCVPPETQPPLQTQQAAA